MAIWKVSRESIELFPHPNGDNLQIAKLGPNQAVVRKGMFKSGDTCVFIPAKSILPPAPLLDSVKNYMKGVELNRVGTVYLRGQISSGLIANPALLPDVADAPIGVDISARLGITKFVPIIPECLLGKAAPMPDVPYKEHDVMEFGIYAADFQPGEEVVVTEKIHGSQGNWFAYQEEGQWKQAVSSKGNLDESRCILPDAGNALWRAAENTSIFQVLKDAYPNARCIQATGEEFPCQKGGWTYGATAPTLRIFKLVVDEKVLTLDEVSPTIKSLWVPILFRGPYDAKVVNEFRHGREQVSGKELHIREGGVLSPLTERRAKDGIRLLVKLINPEYKETGEELS
jgi:RNA ligase (TIGR02306 family)